jgi:hypothetical protein
MRDKNVSLLFRQIFESRIQLFQQHAARISRFWPSIRRRKQIFPSAPLAVLRYECGVVYEVGRTFASKQIDNPIPCHTKQPRTDLLHRLHQTVSSYQFVEDFLKNVFGVATVGDTGADELAQPRLFPRNNFGEPPILIGGGSAGAKHFFHPPG